MSKHSKSKAAAPADPATASTSATSDECERCGAMEARIQDLEQERSDLLLALARERERANALFLAYPPATLAPSGAPAHAAGPTGPLPLRYRLVDKLNDTVKRGLPVVHIAAKPAGPLLRKLT